MLITALRTGDPAQLSLAYRAKVIEPARGPVIPLYGVVARKP